MYLRFQPIGQNIWAVLRDGEKVAEITLSWRGACALIPGASRAFTADELDGIRLFMREAHGKDAAIVLRPSLRPSIGDVQNGRY